MQDTLKTGYLVVRKTFTMRLEPVEEVLAEMELLYLQNAYPSQSALILVAALDHRPLVAE